ncbi:MAG TPA: 5-formyltetrahydrofolate cyclo-ligase [Burkholderiales bacterium]|nr:5-formyltetrahydrofolate cyclo-ligase [Burkholderiales bacterium]
MDLAQLKAWRRQLRAELIARRLAASPDDRSSWNEAISSYLLCAFPNLASGVVAFCWPHQNEFDARFLMREMRDRGAITALPVVLAPKTPMIFREWHPGVKVAKGVYDIPYPVESPELTPDTILVPMNGFDEQGHRLGYGGGYFDRTLASLKKHPCIIGVAYELARVPTIEPQPHDIPMDYIVTERGVYQRSNGKIELLARHSQKLEPGQYSSPACYAHEFAPDYFGGKKE